MLIDNIFVMIKLNSVIDLKLKVKYSWYKLKYVQREGLQNA